ncbi:MAG TPA: hypothetical protein VMB82_03245 [Acidimicrobiales bacterium]|nr:hypothetical protein [Acidimicrobiales bacterium]
MPGAAPSRGGRAGGVEVLHDHLQVLPGDPNHVVDAETEQQGA